LRGLRRVCLLPLHPELLGRPEYVLCSVRGTGRWRISRERGAQDSSRLARPNLRVKESVPIMQLGVSAICSSSSAANVLHCSWRARRFDAGLFVGSGGNRSSGLPKAHRFHCVPSVEPRFTLRCLKQRTNEHLERPGLALAHEEHA
jgi:hypothetical protein